MDTIAGVSEETGDFETWLKREIKTEDVELAYYYPGNAHIITVVGVYTKDGKTYVKYRDDEKQDSATAGDTTIKHAEIYKKNGAYHIHTDNDTIHFAVSESVKPKKPKIEKTGTDKYKIFWDELGDYKLLVSDKPDFSNIIKSIDLDSDKKEYTYEDADNKKALYFRLVRR